MLEEPLNTETMEGDNQRCTKKGTQKTLPSNDRCTRSKRKLRSNDGTAAVFGSQRSKRRKRNPGSKRSLSLFGPNSLLMLKQKQNNSRKENRELLPSQTQEAPTKIQTNCWTTTVLVKTNLQRLQAKTSLFADAAEGGIFSTIWTTLTVRFDAKYERTVSLLIRACR